jgi:hypothetical protein
MSAPAHIFIIDQKFSSTHKCAFNWKIYYLFGIRDDEEEDFDWCYTCSLTISSNFMRVFRNFSFFFYEQTHSFKRIISHLRHRPQSMMNDGREIMEDNLI